MAPVPASRLRSLDRERSGLLSLLEAVPDGTAILDDDGRIQGTNQALRTLAGLAQHDITGQLLVDLLFKDRGSRRVADAMSSPPGVAGSEILGRHIEASLLARHGQKLPVEICLSRVASGRHLHTVCFVRDISMRKRLIARLENERSAAEAADRAKSDWITVLAHEVRTPLNGILGILRLMQDEPRKDIRLGYLKTALTSSETLKSLLGDILDLSKLEAGKFVIEPQPISLRDLVDATRALWEPQFRAKRLAFEAAAPAGAEGHVMGDQGRLMQILHNLLSNALKHTSRGGARLAADIEASEATSLRVRLSVSDTGDGIAKSHHGKVFQAYEQVSGSRPVNALGTGLGLAITRRLAEAMGGSVGFTSETQKGSTFWVSVPLKRVVTGPVLRPAQPVAAIPGLAGRHILIADDDTVNQMVTRLSLKLLGCSSVTVANGHEAIAMLERTTFDAVLMDIAMPGLDGFETTRRIRALGGSGSRIPIVGLTAFTASGLQRDAEAAGMTACIEKPVDPATLDAILDAALSRANRGKVRGRRRSRRTAPA